MSNDDVKTIPVGLTQSLANAELIRWGEMMAAALVGSLPVVLLYSFFVEYFEAGITAGAVKG
jgi:multiple sugar transport system permease protein